MKRMLLFLLICASCTTDSTEARKAELESFMDNYAESLRRRRMDEVANLYDPAGVVRSGDGKNRFIPFDSIRRHYMLSSRIPVNFKWEDTRIDLLDDHTALVTALFYWNWSDKRDTVRGSYTGILTRTPKGWKIKHEHESF